MHSVEIFTVKVDCLPKMTTATGGFARCEVALQCILPKRKITSLFMYHSLNDCSRIGYVNNVMNINHGVS